jgi:hypothetical protein
VFTRIFFFSNPRLNPSDEEVRKLTEEIDEVMSSLSSFSSLSLLSSLSL